MNLTDTTDTDRHPQTSWVITDPCRPSRTLTDPRGPLRTLTDPRRHLHLPYTLTNPRASRNLVNSYRSLRTPAYFGILVDHVTHMDLQSPQNTLNLSSCTLTCSSPFSPFPSLLSLLSLLSSFSFSYLFLISN
jgi:hypothetical protein